MGELAFLTDLVDLHCHLGSSSTPHFLWELAHEQGIRLPEKDYFKFISSVTMRKKTSQERYHAYFDVTQQIQSSPMAVERSVHAAISHAYRVSDVRLMELRFNPMRRNRGGEHDLDKIILGAITGMKKACLEYPVVAGLIIEMDRRFSKAQNEIIAKKAFAFRRDGVVGIDVSGPLVSGFSVDDFVDIYREARDLGLGLTFHTGEFTPASEIWDVATKLMPHRLGHGIHAVEDKKLLTYLTEHDIALEVCPTSNLRTRVVDSWKDMGAIVRTLLSAQVKFFINSDSPELLLTNVRNEYRELVTRGIAVEADVRNMLVSAREASFLSQHSKDPDNGKQFFV